MNVSKKTHSMDYVILILVICLALFGVVMVFSATYYLDQSEGEAGVSYFLKQGWGVLAGIVCMTIFSFIDYHRYNNKFIVYAGIVVSIALLGYVFLNKADINGASRWISIAGVNFQPSEIARIAMVIFVAYVFNKNSEDIRSNSLKTIFNSYWGLFLVIGLTGVLILLENLSTAVILLLMIICMFIVAGSRFKTLFTWGVICGVGGTVGILIEPERIDRFKFFTRPWMDKLDTGYQTMQSLYALGSGGISGVGLGNSTQKYLYLTYSESDYILSIIGEELGFIGICLLMIIFIVLIVRCLSTAIKAPDMFGMYVASGITSIITIQLIVNMAVITASMPPTGVPLPFISAGNTALITFMAAIGILLNISKQRKKLA